MYQLMHYHLPQPSNCDSAGGGSARFNLVGVASSVAGASEHQLHTELHLPRLLRTEDASEVRRAEDPVRHVEVGPVEQIEHFQPGLELTAAGDGPCARQRDVGGAEARPDDAVARRAAERERRGQCERGRVEPPLRRALRPRQVRVAELIRTLGRTRAYVRLVNTEVDRKGGA